MDDEGGGECDGVVDLGTQLPVSVQGTTQGAADAHDFPQCDGVDAGDRAYEWTAPIDGCFRFDTAGSSYDTVLGLLDDCAGRRSRATTTLPV